MDVNVDSVATELGEELINQILADTPIQDVLRLLDSGAPIWYQNLAEGISPLHAAAYVQNLDLVKMLIDKGAVWNAVNHLKHTAGDIALSFNNELIYSVIRDAGIRSELVLGLLERQPEANLSSLILRATDSTASGSSDTFFASKLKYSVNENGEHVCSVDVDGEEVGVMMGWETDIMRKTVEKLCQGHSKSNDLKVLNIGFGLGIIDTFFQELPNPPTEHVIIEPHPDVLNFMQEQGWYERNGVKILEGRWQDFIESDDLMKNGGFDVVYTDTFSEDYSDLRNFFNGLGATNAFFYDIYTRISELHLLGVGLDVQWSDVYVGFDADEDRWGKSREYFSQPFYRLPIGNMKAS
ncbi:hypothetical protein NLJ89_g1877 [Agrocybe chaxingu]|uniref:RMT2 domain-containing protein n=1 Tax=Agrocybe chaxingu TaxID=84603 RepID=A0A9W8MZ71_9AGAR|nr:hypothetical protein NLJ89_g1877 [Agrocybe chaxingu]